MKTTTPELGQSLNSLNQRRELLDAKTELETVRRKLVRTENVLESLTGFLTVIPDPIEIISEDLAILFANEASKRLHNNSQLEGTLYYTSVLNLDGSPDSHTVRSALREKRELVFSSVFDGGDVYEITVTPTTLSDGRRAAVCISKPVVLSGAVPPDGRRRDADRPGVSVRYPDQETDLIERIATLSTRTLDAVLDQISDGVVVANDRGEVILANRAFYDITDRKPGDLLSLSELFSPFHPAARPVAQTEPRRFETTVPGSHGKQIPVEISVVGIPKDAENPAGVLITVRNLRETHEIKEQLISSLNLSLAGERIATLAHQVNNYLTPAFHHADVLAQRDDLDVKTRQSVVVIQNYLNLCHESILMVLSLIRSSVPVAVNVNNLISEMFSKHYFADELRLDNVEIVQHFDPCAVETLGYRVLLQQALVNIIKNAREAMAQQSGRRRVTIVTESTPATITIRISDNGPGVPPEIQDNIFKLLVSSKPEGKGYGIGLRFTKEVIDKHGGTITLNNKPGEGAIFEIRLPVRAPEEPVSPQTARIGSPESIPQSSARLIAGNILIIDDEPGILELLSDILVKQKHTVTTTEDAHDALVKISAETYDCIICDIKMPDMDGPEFSRSIKTQMPELYDRLVFITGDIFSDDTDTFIRDTSSPCIEKPFTSEQIYDVVQGVLGRSQARATGTTGLAT